MFIKRDISSKLKKSVKQFPILGLIGPRQSGKTTLLKNIFPKYAYANLEDLELREFAQNDPKGFLQTYKSPLIIDEAQRVPSLFSQIQVIVDEEKKMGSYILSGSQNFLMMESIGQSLAGRISLQTLLPLSYAETKSLYPDTVKYSQLIAKGQYPKVYEQKNLDSADFYNTYLATYVERDLRQIVNVTDLSAFQRFLKLCAGRIGQIINYSSLAQDAGITHNTAKAWLSILEASFIIYQLQPYYKNFNKRLIKSPKIYFYDTGLAAWLLNIENQDQVRSHFALGGLFENLIITEYLKHQLNLGKRANCYFWRDQQKREIDLIIDRASKPIAIEIKAGKTISSDYFRHLLTWNSLDTNNSELNVIYGGKIHQKRSKIKVLPWMDSNKAWS